MKKDNKDLGLKFFVDDISSPIIGDDVLHIKNSLRKQVGDVLLVNCEGYDCLCKITKIDNAVYFDCLSREICTSEPNIKVHLFQGIPKGDKFELIIQKAVELGVYEITPFISDFTNVDTAKIQKKLERFNKIAKEAAKQSGRGIIPKINSAQNLKKLLQFENKNAIILYEEKVATDYSSIFDLQTSIGIEISKKFQDLNFEQNTNVFIGSEGGFSRCEIDLALRQNITPVWLGERVLKCETAAIAALTLIMFKSGNL